MSRYRDFAEARNRELCSAGQIASTPLGPIEYAESGPGERGLPWLLFHGGPGGFDQGRVAGPVADRMLTWSRPGYLRTPLSVGATFAAQGDAAAALLDAVGVDEVIVHGISAGGPAAIELARRHPHRVRALVLESAVTRHYAPHVSAIARAIFLSGRGTWLSRAAARRFPKAIVSDFVKRESTLDRRARAATIELILGDPTRRQVFTELIDSLTPYDRRAAGLDNDLAQLATLDDSLVEGVRCPTLVLHGSHDADVDVAHAEHAARAIPGAQLCVLEGGWHVLTLSSVADAAIAAKVDFLASLDGACDPR